MSEKLLKAPTRQTPSSHRLHKDAEMTGNVFLAATIELEHATRHITDEFINNRIGLAEAREIAAACGHAAEVKLAMETSATSTHQDIYRFKARKDFMVECALAEIAYTQNDSDLRARLSDGLPGASIDHIEQYLDMYGTIKGSDYRESERSHVRGVLAEATVAAVLNDSNRKRQNLFVPGSAAEDIYCATDGYLLHRTHGVGYRVPVSVKTSYTHTLDERLKRPQHLVIGGCDVQNNDRHDGPMESRRQAHRTSADLVDRMKGREDPDGKRCERLQNVKSELSMLVSAHLSKNPGKRLV